MAKWQNDAMLDAALSYISTNSTQLFVCSGQPVDYAGITAVALTDAAAPGFDAAANGDVSGRKLRVQEEASISVAASGNATHIALAAASGAASGLLYVTTCTSQALTAGNTVTVPAWDIEIADVTS